MTLTLLRLRICPRFLDGLCAGGRYDHCSVHVHQPGCEASWCDGEKVGACEIYSGETIVPYPSTCSSLAEPDGRSEGLISPLPSADHPNERWTDGRG